MIFNSGPFLLAKSQWLLLSYYVFVFVKEKRYPARSRAEQQHVDTRLGSRQNKHPPSFYGANIQPSTSTTTSALNHQVAFLQASCRVEAPMKWSTL
jgi:hypothetical protein